MVVQAVQVARLLRTFNEPADGASLKSRDLAIQLLEGSLAPFSRDQFTPGHVTCSGIVFHPSRAAILTIYHIRLNRWLLPGGHVEATDGSMDETARREILEETSVECDPQSPKLAGVDVHGIPAHGKEPYHLHHDLIFCYRASTAAIRINPEIRAAEWRDAEDFYAFRIATNVRLAYDRVRELYPDR